MIRAFLKPATSIATHRDLRPPVLKEYRSHVFKYLLSLAMSIKDPAWRDEQEWRLLVVQPHDQSGFTRLSRPDGVCYFELPICSAHTVREVVLGPRCDLEQQALSQFLIQVGMPAVPIRRSSCES
jgi:hypothetical protein